MSSAHLETRLYRDIESVVVRRRGQLNKDPEPVTLIELFSLEVSRPKNVQGYMYRPTKTSEPIVSQDPKTQIYCLIEECVLALVIMTENLKIR